jgi:septal ring factor EnvC (AmiA/AmiB activator)
MTRFAPLFAAALTLLAVPAFAQSPDSGAQLAAVQADAAAVRGLLSDAWSRARDLKVELDALRGSDERLTDEGQHALATLEAELSTLRAEIRALNGARADVADQRMALRKQQRTTTQTATAMAARPAPRSTASSTVVLNRR